MRISVVAVGKIRERYLKEALDEYRKRLTRFCDLEVLEVEDESAEEGMSPALVLQVKKKEADRIRKRIRDNSTVIALDVRGQSLGSDELASKLNAMLNAGISNITFVIGGSLGLEDDLVQSAHFRLSLSRLTFPHQITRLILIEQIYRVFKIIHGETYHK